MGTAIPLITSVGSEQLAAFVITGAIGAFTTFSTFSLETLILIQERQGVRAVLYVLASILLGLLSLGAGVFVVNSI
jgi:CrcB protein